MSATLRGVTSSTTPVDATPHAPPTTEGAGRGWLVRRWAGDLAALAPLVVGIAGIADLDGGRGLAGTWPLALSAAVATPAVLGELRRLPRAAVVTLAAWLGGLVLGVVFAVVREHAVVPLLQYTIAPIVVLATRRVWRRPWAPGVLLLVLLVAFGRYQERAWSIWWARTEAGEGLWRTLSWRNQSAALTGMFGVWFLGAALASRRLVRAGLVLAAVTGLAGTWLSSSRAGLAVTLAAAAIAVVLGWRSALGRGEAWWRPAVPVLAAVVGTAMLVAALLGMQPSGSADPLGSRDQDVGQNTLARVEHTEAALGMFADRPLTGQGLGSYRDLMREWNDPNGNLTGSAHDEYAEVAGEAGVLAAGALLAVLLGSAVLGVRILRDTPTADRLEDLRAPMVVGGVAALALLVVHAGLDFDWNYPVLTTLAAVGLGIAMPDPAGRAGGRVLATVTGAGLVVLLVAGLAGGVVERGADPAPWDAGAFVASGEAALGDGAPDRAIEDAERALRWNPASAAAASLQARATYARDGDAEALVRAIMQDPRWFGGRARAALALAEAGDADVADEVADALLADIEAFAAWGVTQTRLMAVEAHVAAAATRSCDQARAVADAALADEDTLPDVAPVILAERLEVEGCAPA